MKTFSTTMALLMVSFFAFAGNELDGKAFCRTVLSDGLFGQPAGERQHCIRFENGLATDDANTFFGNPPESAPYNLKGRILTFGTSKYVVSKDLSELVSIHGSTLEGTILTAQ